MSTVDLTPSLLKQYADIEPVFYMVTSKGDIKVIDGKALKEIDENPSISKDLNTPIPDSYSDLVVDQILK